MKVLIAEDDQISAQVLCSHLQKWGHEVITAETGTAAWRLFQQDDIALVITDWMMPEMDGLELVRRIRSSPRPGYVYIILLTAKSRKEDIVRGMDAGADDFLVKPFDREELRVRLRAGERIVQLEQSLARRNEELQTANAQISAANRRMQRDLEAAAKIQHALLPTSLPDTAQACFAWTFKPCEELAGDILGVVNLDEEHVALYALDVSGHGVAAALSSVSVRHLLSPSPSGASILRQRLPGSNAFYLARPAEVAEELNQQFPMDPATGQFFTLIYGILNLNTHEFRFVSAGHPAPIHLPRQRPPVALTCPGFPIGVNDQAVYQDQILQLGPGDRLYLCSDGIPEAFNDREEQFGTARLMATLDENRGLSLQASLDHLLQAVEGWYGSAGPVDDVSVLAVEIAPKGV
jgi:sigma-B regulation protein RsbU (phosphoserine phosphatase)